MAITYKGQKLTGTICRQSAYAGGNQHFVLNGAMLCPSGLNFHANDLIVRSYLTTNAKGKNCFLLVNAKKALQYVSCKKCHKKLNELIQTVETKNTNEEAK